MRSNYGNFPHSDLGNHLVVNWRNFSVINRKITEFFSKNLQITEFFSNTLLNYCKEFVVEIWNSGCDKQLSAPHSTPECFLKSINKYLTLLTESVSKIIDHYHIYTNYNFTFCIQFCKRLQHFKNYLEICIRYQLEIFSM